VVGPASILDRQTAFAMQTLCGNPVSCAAGLAVLETIAKEGLVDNAWRRGEQLTAGLRQLMARHAVIGDVRGRGLAIGVELVEDRVTKIPASRFCQKVVYRCYERGLLLFYVGMSSNVLELTPPLTLTETEAADGLAILDQVLGEVAAGAVIDADIAAYAGW
jgi:4-aminobutyrate aminotransferase